MKKIKMNHPLVDPKSPHYVDKDGKQQIEKMEADMTVCEMLGFAKGNVLKYNARLGKKDNPKRDQEKIDKYRNYGSFLLSLLDMEQKKDPGSFEDMFLGSVKDLYKKANVKIIYEPGEEDENNS
jgi:hypothetical protein